MSHNLTQKTQKRGVELYNILNQMVLFRNQGIPNASEVHL
jgi:hypothetical protein